MIFFCSFWIFGGIRSILFCFYRRTKLLPENDENGKTSRYSERISNSGQATIDQVSPPKNKTIWHTNHKVLLFYFKLDITLNLTPFF